LKTSEIFDIFDADGLLSQRFPGYEYRDGQLEMALMVQQAYQEHAIAAIEAGTGIGKSFAYLVPALLWALEHPKERTVVATSTINLQNQLFRKDLVQLFDLLHTKVRVALVMGRSNYLCLRRLEEFAEQTPLVSRDPLSEIGAIVAWSAETETGLRTDFPGPLSGSLWSEICSDADLCTGYRCSYAKDCFFMRSRKRAAESSIIVANHHLLFTDARSRMIDGLDYQADAVLPPFQRLIIDEAHNIEKNATDFFTQTYSTFEVLRTLGHISRKRRGNTSLIEELALYLPSPVLVDQITGEISLLSESIGYLDTYLVSLMQQWRLRTVLVGVEQQQLMSDVVPLGKAVLAHIIRLSELSRQVVESVAIPDELDMRVQELAVYIRRVRASGDALERFIDFASWNTDVYWMELTTHPKQSSHAALHISPLSVAQPLRQTIFSQLDTVICTSATLDLNDSFAYWGSRVGLPASTDRTYLSAVHHSPFDFKERLLLLTPNDAPVYTEKTAEAFGIYCVQTIRHAIYASGGGALVLFTSYRMLTSVADALSSDLIKAGITLLRQGDEDRSRLLHRFVNDEDSVLFATDSFWEGVDAPGNTLRLVVIVKLPFRVPSEPVFRARQEALDREGRSGFFQLALPEATMRLKQGFGRLLRNALDSGIVLILDSRVVQKQYGQWMLQALPESFHPETTSDGVPGKIESFLYR
jgi:ATP-dependent DNA helicase DinG